jgi:hypothetical protein
MIAACRSIAVTVDISDNSAASIDVVPRTIPHLFANNVLVVAELKNAMTRSEHGL